MGIESKKRHGVNVEEKYNEKIIKFKKRNFGDHLKASYDRKMNRIIHPAVSRINNEIQI